MNRGYGGFTIIEILIVIVVGTFLVAVVIATTRGQISNNSFNQTMYDLDSKIQSTVSDISSGNQPDLPNGYRCDIDPISGRPVLTTSPGADSSNCIFLGKAIQVVPGSDSLIYFYNIYGDRDKWVNGEDSGMAAANLAEANPNPAIDSTSGTLFSPDQYRLEGASISSAGFVGQTGEFDLMGIYASLQNTNSVGGVNPATVLGRTYQFNSSPTSVGSTAIKDCIEENASCSNNFNLGQWFICLQSGSNSGKITVTATPTGLTTQLGFNQSCP